MTVEILLIWYRENIVGMLFAGIITGFKEQFRIDKSNKKYW